MNLSVEEGPSSEMGMVDTVPSVPRYDLTLLWILKGSVLISIILLAVLSNIMVIVSVVYFRKLRHVNNYFLVSLAFADLFVAIFAMTFNATVEISDRWMFSSLMCNIWNSMDVHASTVSTLHLCCISVDRYYAIAKPLVYHDTMTVKVAFCMIAVAWIIPSTISFIPIFTGWYTTSEYLKHKEYHPDECRFVVNKTYAFLSSSMTFWIPVIVMLTLYYRIYLEAKRHKAAIRRHSSSLYTSLSVMNSTSLSIITHGASCPPSTQSSTQHSTSNSTLKLKQKSLSSERLNEGGEAPRTKRLYSLNKSPKSSRIRRDRRMSTPVVKINSPDNPCRLFTTQTKLAREPKHNAKFLSAKGYLNKKMSLQDGSRVIGPGRGLTKNDSSVQLDQGSRDKRTIKPAAWRKEHKAFVTLGVVMGAFLLCWLPFFLWYLTITICGSACPCPDVVVSILFWIGYFNSTLNPFIYVMTNQDFKRAFTTIIEKLFFCSKKSARNSADFEVEMSRVSQAESVYRF